MTRTGNRYSELADRDWLVDHYGGQTIQEIAVDLGCTPSAVFLALQRQGIETHGRKTKRYKDRPCAGCGTVFSPTGPRSRHCENCGRSQPAAPKNPQLRDTDWLLDQYVGQRKSTNRIAEEIGTSSGNVWWYLKQAGVSLRGTHDEPVYVRQECEICDAPYEPTGPASRFCEPCAQWRREQREQSRLAPEPACDQCGEPTTRGECSWCGRKPERPTLVVKRCTVCKVDQPVDEFGVDSSRGDGLDATCCSCRTIQRRQRDPAALRQQGRDYYANNKDKWQAYSQARRDDPEKHQADLIRLRRNSRQFRLKQMGWDTDLYERLVAEQGNKCAMCEFEPKPGFHLAIDHDHETGEPRQLLCRPCNLVIGNANDSIEVLWAGIEYLSRHVKGTLS